MSKQPRKPIKWVGNAKRDLDAMPDPLRAYVRRAGAVGRPRPREVTSTWRGEMRSSREASWMRVAVTQVNRFEPSERLFYLRASRSGVPFEALHVMEGRTATMRVRAASLFDVVDAKGPEMDRSETVTLFNDMAVLAPGALVAADVRWSTVDDRHVRGTFTNDGITVSAVLEFDDAGDLVGFVSHDRLESADGKTFASHPWSTPLRAPRDYGDGVRVPSGGEAIWKDPDFVYGRFELVAIRYGRAPSAPPPERHARVAP